MHARVRALGSQALEHEVPNEVCRCERSAPCVQRLEDLLRVLVDREVDRDELQPAGKHARRAPGHARPPRLTSESNHSVTTAVKYSCARTTRDAA